MREFLPFNPSKRVCLALALFASVGCAGPEVDPDDAVSPQVTVEPADRPVSAPPPALARPGLIEASADRGPEPAGVPVQAMVGQIAGQPIYAHRILDGLEPQLESLARRLPASTFRDQALELIYGRVAELIRNALITDAAERALTPQQLAGLDFFIASRREELLRVYGQGSLALAERNILEATGYTLSQTLRDVRTRTMVDIYLDRNLKPLINVSRRDIERFYRDNYDAFNPPTKRQVQLIYAEGEEDAAWFRAELDRGVSFDELAADSRNNFGGKATPLPLEGDSMMGDNIDPVLLELGEGEWAGPLPNRGQQWFVRVAELEVPESRSLFEAQVDIERALREFQERELQTQLGLELREGASVTDEQQMAMAVLEIVVARYAPLR